MKSAIESRSQSWLSCCLALLLSCIANGLQSDEHKPESSSVSSVEPATYVLVHGATGGGWDWKVVADMLIADGHTVFRPTLTGLGEKHHLNSPEISLSTHIDDIVNLFLFEDLSDVILVGHSYGGMVITGVMNRIPERIRHAVFLDAAVPGDGMSTEDLWGKVGDDHRVVDGIIYFNWLDPDASWPADVPQSLRTFTEPVSFSNPAALDLPATLIVFSEPMRSREELSADVSWQMAESRGWSILVLESDHNAQRSHPRELTDMLVSVLITD